MKPVACHYEWSCISGKHAPTHSERAIMTSRKLSAAAWISIVTSSSCVASCHVCVHMYTSRRQLGESHTTHIQLQSQQRQPRP